MNEEQDLELMLASALTTDNAREKQIQNSNKLRMTEGCYAKIQLYADLTSRITHSNMECYGYLLRKKWSTDDIITNVYFADDQVVSQAYVRVEVEGIRKAKREITKDDYEIVGWWHSHGGLGVFHSGTDKQNFEKILDEVAIDTLHRYEDQIYVVDEKNRTVVFENNALTNLSDEELAVFKKRNIPAYKKADQKPYAFSMVVNNQKGRYLEKMTKSKNPATGEYAINAPTHPQFEAVKINNDLSFLVADVEWEVREKISMRYNILNGRNINHSEIDEQNIGLIVGDFKSELEEYAKKGTYASNAKKILAEPANIYLALAGLKKQEANENKTWDEKNFNINLKAYFMQINEEDYTKWKQRVHYFDRQHIVARKFAEDFTYAVDEKGKENRIMTQDRIFERYSRVAEKLEDGFSVADKAMKALSKYSMETTTDYTNSKNHKYRNLIGAALTKICNNGIESIDDAIAEVISNPRACERKPLFIWEDRFKICDQMIMDVYGSEISSQNKKPDKYNRREKTLLFLKDFADKYDDGPAKLDELIESGLLPNYGVAQKRYRMFTDAEFKPGEIIYRVPEWNIFKPRPAKISSWPINKTKPQPTINPPQQTNYQQNRPKGFWRRLYQD